MSEVKGHRKIQSFVKRSGRLSKAQSLGLNDLWSDFGVETNDKELINFDRIFVKQNDITLEVGFGNGDSLLEMAIKQPFQNFIGIEVYEAGVGRIINEASKQNVSNLKIIKDDAVEVIANNILMKVFRISNYFFLILGTKRSTISVELSKQAF